MGGIVALFAKDPALRPELGRWLAEMLTVMSDRGPDSASFAIHGDTTPGHTKVTLRTPAGAGDLGPSLAAALDLNIQARSRDTHLVLTRPTPALANVRATAWPCCATRLPASPPSWPRPTATSPSAPNTARWRCCPASLGARWEPKPAQVYVWKHPQ